jgi:Tol biopolymer transport system component
MGAPTSAMATTATQSPSGLAIAFVQDGDLRMWEEATGQTRTLFDAGDVVGVTMSDDGQVLAFLRRSAVQKSDTEWLEQSALWAVDRSGENARELVSAEDLRTLLGASDRDSTNVPEMRWIPGTHRLLYNGWTYLVQAEGESHAVPRGVFSVDVDAGTQQVVVPAEQDVHFVVSPDGQRLAVMSPTALSFVNADGSDLQKDVLTFAEVGVPGPIFPTGVWTEDSSAFLITGSLETDPTADFDFAIWRVPWDGSAPTRLASIRRSHPASVTFSPDGKSVGHIQYTDGAPPDIAGWFVTPLEGGAGPLAIPPELEVGYASLHWSPDGRAFNATLQELCPGATQSSEVCDAPVSFGGSAAAVRWIDPTHVLFLTRDPSVLFLVTLDTSGRMDATTVPIVAWPLEESMVPYGFATAGASR